jgi:hypothetical protein
MAKPKERAATLSMFEVEGELALILNALDEGEDTQDNPEMDAALGELLEGAAQKRDAVGFKLKQLKADEERDRALANELLVRARQKAAAHDRIKNMVLRVMQAQGRSDLKGDVYRFVKARNPDHVEVLNPELLPLGCTKVVVTPDKRAIADLIESEGHCPGADLVAGDERVDLKMA